jgi:hypothetical protein
MKNVVTMQSPKKYGKAENELAIYQAAEVMLDSPVMPRALVGIALECLETLHGYACDGKIKKEYNFQLFWMSQQLESMCDHFGCSDDGWGHYDEYDHAEDEGPSAG